MKRRSMLIGILLVLIGLTVFLMGTYAFWKMTLKQTNQNVVGTACLDIEFSNESEDISLEKMWPTSDSDGASLTPYSFTITNHCNNEVYYDIYLESIDNSKIISENNGYLSYNYLKLKLDNYNPILYSDLDSAISDENQNYTIRDTKKIKTIYLARNSSRTHSLRLWVDENTPLKNQDGTSNVDRYFFGKVKIVASQNHQEFANTPNPENCFTVNNEGVLTSYDIDRCGTNLVIPDKVNGIAIKRIESGFLLDRTSELTSVDLSYLSSLEEIGEGAFIDYDSNDIPLIFPENLKIIENSAFMSYQGRNTELIIPDSVYQIGEDAFSGYNGIHLQLSNKLKTIKDRAFLGYVGTKTLLVLPDSVETIGNSAFGSFYGSDLKISKNLQTLGAYNFEFYSGSSLVLPSTLTKLAVNCFNAYDTTDVVIPSSVSVIESGVLDDLVNNRDSKANKVIIKRTDSSGMTIPSSWNNNEYVIFNSNY